MTEQFLESNPFQTPVSEAETIVLPVPWDVSTTYRSGTANAPTEIYNCLYQLDAYHPLQVDINETAKVHFCPVSMPWMQQNQRLRTIAAPLIRLLERGDTLSETQHDQLQLINQQTTSIYEAIKHQSTQFLNHNQQVVILGGEHGVGLGLLQALAEKHPDFGVLQLDAHMDLRDTYLGFSFSHASAMHLALQLPQITRLVAVGIRDFDVSELTVVQAFDGRIKPYLDQDLFTWLDQGRSWHDICQEIVDLLPQYVFISCDIDGLDPSLCPNTGTPVPGGLSMHQLTMLLDCLRKSGRQIIGADLVEVAPAPFSRPMDASVHELRPTNWNEIVGARVLMSLVWALAPIK